MKRDPGQPAIPQAAYDTWRAQTMRDDVMGGSPCVPGTRLTCDTVALRVLAGDILDLLDDYPYLTAEDVVFCLLLRAETAPQKTEQLTPRRAAELVKDLRDSGITLTMTFTAPPAAAAMTEEDEETT